MSFIDLCFSQITDVLHRFLSFTGFKQSAILHWSVSHKSQIISDPCLTDPLNMTFPHRSLIVLYHHFVPHRSPVSDTPRSSFLTDPNPLQISVLHRSLTLTDPLQINYTPIYISPTDPCSSLQSLFFIDPCFSQNFTDPHLYFGQTLKKTRWFMLGIEYIKAVK